MIFVLLSASIQDTTHLTEISIEQSLQKIKIYSHILKNDKNCTENILDTVFYGSTNIVGLLACLQAIVERINPKTNSYNIDLKDLYNIFTTLDNELRPFLISITIYHYIESAFRLVLDAVFAALRIKMLSILNFINQKPIKEEIINTQNAKIFQDILPQSNPMYIAKNTESLMFHFRYVILSSNSSIYKESANATKWMDYFAQIHQKENELSEYQKNFLISLYHKQFQLYETCLLSIQRIQKKKINKQDAQFLENALKNTKNQYQTIAHQTNKQSLIITEAHKTNVTKFHQTKHKLSNWQFNILYYYPLLILFSLSVAYITV
jgi:hypothetical protein